MQRALATSNASASSPRSQAIIADIAISGPSGLVLLAGALFLAGLSGPRRALLAALGALSWPSRPRWQGCWAAGLRGRCGLVGAASLAWAGLSVAVVATDALPLSDAGTAVALTQAVVVAGVGAIRLGVVRAA